MSSKIKVIVETLAKDGTNPEVNKKAIVELGNEADAIPNVEDAEDGTIDKALGLDVNGKLVKGAVSGGKLYNHIVCVGKSDDSEDEPWLTFSFQSSKETYTKAEIEDFIKAATDANNNQNLICLASNSGYSQSLEGVYALGWSNSTSKFICIQQSNKTNTAANHTFNCTTFGYFSIKSAEI